MRWELLSHSLAGAVLTVRPRGLLMDGVLWAHRDLEPFDALLIGPGAALATGGYAKRGGTEVATVTGPDGWLPTLRLGQLLALSWDGTLLHVEVIDSVPDPRDPVVPRARSLLALHKPAYRARSTGYGRAYAHSDGTSYGGYRGDGELEPPLAQIVLSALREVPDLLSQPLPPLSELLPLPETELDNTSRGRATATRAG